MPPSAHLSTRGSSPHVRGTFHLKQYHAPIRRFIPARAGNIRGSCGYSTISTVHPRTCGEHSRSYAAHVYITGSSPHVRGTFADGSSYRRLYRFIPARAGNMGGYDGYVHDSPVHPRTCGEHGQYIQIPPGMDGSSPHVRGTCWLLIYDNRLWRFIPARAGNIRIYRTLAGGTTVHPRTCGEHRDESRPAQGSYGSSPHVRGTWSGRPQCYRSRRFIPARAGNIQQQPQQRVEISVHPRTCGEHLTRPT